MSRLLPVPWLPMTVTSCGVWKSSGRDTTSAMSPSSLSRPTSGLRTPRTANTSALGGAVGGRLATSGGAGPLTGTGGIGGNGGSGGGPLASEPGRRAAAGTGGGAAPGRVVGCLPKSLDACEVVGVPTGTSVTSSSGSVPAPADTRGAPKIAPGAVSDIRRESFDKRLTPYRPALPPGKQRPDRTVPSRIRNQIKGGDPVGPAPHQNRPEFHVQAPEVYAAGLGAAPGLCSAPHIDLRSGRRGLSDRRPRRDAGLTRIVPPGSRLLPRRHLAGVHRAARRLGLLRRRRRLPPHRRRPLGPALHDHSDRRQPQLRQPHAVPQLRRPRGERRAHQAAVRRRSPRRRRPHRSRLVHRDHLPRMVRHPIAALAAAATAMSVLAAPAAADAYLRVISQRAPVHTGPGGAYRELYVAERGEVFQVLERGGDGFWFRVELEDGTTGWILGELVFPFEVVDEENPGVFVRMGRAIRRT